MVVAEGLIGAASLVAGWYGRDVVDAAATSWARRRRVGAAETLRENGPEWLLEYYLGSGAANNLFSLETGRRVPYLTKPEWHYPHARMQAVSVEVVTHRSAVGVDNTAVDRRRKLGQRIWDDQVLSLSGITERGDQTRILLGSCSYFQYVTVADQMTSELVASVRRKKGTPYRDRHAGSIEHLEQGRLDAQIAGFTTALVLTLGGTRQVLVQRRSMETGVGGGSLSVVPACVANTSQVASAVGVDLARQLFYIELLEELYDHEELISTMKRPSLDWIRDTWPVDKLEEAVDVGFHFKRLGFGFDAVTGEFHQAFVALVESEELSSEIMRDMQASWEVHDVELHEIEGEGFVELISNEDMYPTSAFTLTLAREYLRDA